MEDMSELDEYRNNPDYGRDYSPLHTHADECTCRRCHTVHIAFGMVCIYSRLYGTYGLSCCERQIETWVEENKWCREHGDAYMHKDGFCGECKAKQGVA